MCFCSQEEEQHVWEGGGAGCRAAGKSGDAAGYRPGGGPGGATSRSGWRAKDAVC